MIASEYSKLLCTGMTDILYEEVLDHDDPILQWARGVRLSESTTRHLLADTDPKLSAARDRLRRLLAQQDAEDCFTVIGGAE